jgi:hypothetical protein
MARPHEKSCSTLRHSCAHTKSAGSRLDLKWALGLFTSGRRYVRNHEPAHRRDGRFKAKWIVKLLATTAFVPRFNGK